jgi:hypothetical protein
LTSEGQYIQEIPPSADAIFLVAPKHPPLNSSSIPIRTASLILTRLDRADHQVSFMCDDIHATSAELAAKGIEIAGEPQHERLGMMVMLRLPGGVDVMLYQPRHPLAISC